MNKLAEQKLKLAAAALSGLLLLQLLWGGGRLLFLSEPDPVMPVGSVLTPDLARYLAPALAGNSGIVERPLFWQGRQAFAYTPSTEVESEEGDTAVSTNDPINKVKLVGLYSGEASGVIVKLGGARHRVAINESLEGWALKSTSADEAVFEKGTNTRTFELQHTAPKPPKESVQLDKSTDSAETETENSVNSIRNEEKKGGII